MSRISKDEYYLKIAEAVTVRSTCLRRHYGCVIVKEDTIVSTGYNGSPRGSINCCDVGICARAEAQRYTDYTLCNSVHAEQNAIIHADRSKTLGATAYLACWDVETQQFDPAPIPCPLCLRMLINAGVDRVVNTEGVAYEV